MKLLLTRHGETTYNKQRKFYGSADVSLDAHGQAQAQQLADKLIAQQLTALVKTNLQRTAQTLAPIRHRQPHLPVVTLPDLAEKGFGNWEGLDADQIEAAYPGEWQKWLATPLTYTPPTVESFAAFVTRVHHGMDWLLSHLRADDTALVVAHLGTIRVLYQALVAPQADFYSLQFPAACYTSIELDDHRNLVKVELNQ